jgi:hypothetical protein
LDTICDLHVEIDGNRVKVTVEEVRVDPQRDAGISVPVEDEAFPKMRRGWPDEWARR